MRLNAGDNRATPAAPHKLMDYEVGRLDPARRTRRGQKVLTDDVARRIAYRFGIQ
jgi:hypothetical protein